MTEPSAEMIEAAARAEYAVDMTAEESDDFEPFTWDEALPKVTTYYRRRAAAALAAALSVGEVREEWGVVPDQIELCVHHCTEWTTCTQWFPHVHNKVRTVRTFPDGSVLTSPWTAVPNEEKTDG